MPDGRREDLPGPSGRKWNMLRSVLGRLFRGRYVVTALDNGNPHGGWNIILGGPWGQREKWEGNGSEKDGGRGKRRWDWAFLRVPLFRRDSYLPCVPPLRSIFFSDAIYFRARGSIPTYLFRVTDSATNRVHPTRTLSRTLSSSIWVHVSMYDVSDRHDLVDTIE